MTKDSEEVETNSHDRRDSGSSIRSNYVTSQTSILRIYSLAKHEFIKEFPTFYVDEDPARITCVKSSSIAIVLVRINQLQNICPPLTLKFLRVAYLVTNLH